MADYGVDDAFMKELGEKLTPGSAALIVLVRSMTPDKILPNIQEQGHVIQSSLSNEAEGQLNRRSPPPARELPESRPCA